MLRHLSIGLLASAVAMAPLPLKVQEGRNEHQTNITSDDVVLKPGPGTGVNNEPAPPDERFKVQE